MYAIETDLGRFTGDDERSAKRALRKAQREAKEKDQRDRENYQLAHCRAQAQAFIVLERKLRGDDEMPRGWRVLPLPQWSCEEKQGDEVWERKWRVRTANASDGADARFHVAVPSHVVENGSGFAIGLVFHDAKGVYAVGIEADQVAVVEIPTVRVEDFDH